MDREEIGAAALREIERETLEALGSAAKPARAEKQAAASAGLEVLDRDDHRLLERGVQQLLAGKTARSRLDDLGFVSRFLDLDVETVRPRQSSRTSSSCDGSYRLRRTNAAYVCIATGTPRREAL